MSDNLPQIENFYLNLLKAFNASETLPAIKLQFYPYVGLSSRIRLREDVLHVKISDALREAHLEFHHALAEILVRKLFRKRIPAAVSKIYKDYVNQTEIREKSLAMKKARGRKVLNGSQGDFYNLDEIFDLINHLYFQDKILKPTLSWSAAKTYRILGHHDAAHSTIIVSRSLDSRQVPRFVVEYVVYHEMLHIKHPTQIINGRHYNHTAAFRRDEEEFAFFKEAEDWIEQNSANLKRATKRSKKVF